MTNKVGFKHYKDHDGKNIKYYDRIVIFYINNEGKEVHHSFSNKDSRDYLVTYNDKFESVVVKSKTGITNIHRIIAITFGNEIVEKPRSVMEELWCKKGQSKTSQDTNNISPELLVILGLGEYVSETDENGHSKYVFRMKKDVKSSPQDILLAMEIEKWKQEQDNKVNNHKGLENLANILKDWNKAFNNAMTPNPITLSKKENKTHEYPLIYKLKERSDYKDMIRSFNLTKSYYDYIILIYNHNTDRFDIVPEPFIPEQVLKKPNITILDVYKKNV